MFVKKGDKVRVIAGKDKGVEAVVVTALPKVNKVIVEGVNIVQKHQKPNNENPQIARYNLVLKAKYLMVTNGLNHYFCRMDFENEKYVFLKELPEYSI